MSIHCNACMERHTLRSPSNSLAVLRQHLQHCESQAPQASEPSQTMPSQVRSHCKTHFTGARVAQNDKGETRRKKRPRERSTRTEPKQPKQTDGNETTNKNGRRQTKSERNSNQALSISEDEVGPHSNSTIGKEKDATLYNQCNTIARSPHCWEHWNC